MNLLLVEPAEVDAAGDVRLAGVRAAHLIDVLKVQPGSGLRLGILDGAQGRGTVTSVTSAEVSIRCVFDAAAPPRPAVDVLLALPRPKVLRRLWAQIAALGVGRIMLTNAARVERHYFDSHIVTPACYRPLLIEGLQQARDTRVPEVSVHRQFKVLVEDELDELIGNAIRLAADPASTRSARDATEKIGGRRIVLAIGPEGGWNRFELAVLEAHGFDLIGLGPRTLRSDTACIALLAIVHELAGQADR